MDLVIPRAMSSFVRPARTSFRLPEADSPSPPTLRYPLPGRRRKPGDAVPEDPEAALSYSNLVNAYSAHGFISTTDDESRASRWA